MRIERKTLVKPLEDIKAGEIFECNEKLYMKLNILPVAMFQEPSAVDLDNGELVVIIPSACVTPVNAKVVIE